MHFIGSLFKWLLELHQLAWYVTGAVSFSAITYLYMKLKQIGKFSKRSFIFIILSSLTFSFASLWTYDSYIENEVRAANMGVLVFCGMAVVFGLIAFRMINIKDNKATTKSK